MFEARKELLARLSAAESENTDLISQIETLNARVAESAGLSEQVAELSEDLEAAKDALTSTKEEHATALAALQADLTAAQAKSAPEAIQAAVTEELAKCSHFPIEVNAEAEAQQATKKEVSRAEFNQMNPRQKSEFSLSGGKITE